MLMKMLRRAKKEEGGRPWKARLRKRQRKKKKRICSNLGAQGYTTPNCSKKTEGKAELTKISTAHANAGNWYWKNLAIESSFPQKEPARQERNLYHLREKNCIFQQTLLYRFF